MQNLTLCPFLIRDGEAALDRFAILFRKRSPQP